MSGVFIVEYSGWPIRLPSLDLTTAERASQFISEADAWTEIHRANLDPAHCQVVPLTARTARADARPTNSRPNPNEYERKSH